MLVNEFPRLVADCVAKTNDPGLWVLQSPAPAGIVAGTLVTPASVRGRGDGGADGAAESSDRAIDVHELFRYASNAVAQTAVVPSDGERRRRRSCAGGRGRDTEGFRLAGCGAGSE